LSKDGIVLDRSGSCAVVILIVDDMMYFANVGDSRAILSKNHGEHVIPVTVDHKPSDLDEQKRISLAGGRVYQ
jgi:serine/threonine protein phosphatase PrpC